MSTSIETPINPDYFGEWEGVSNRQVAHQVPLTSGVAVLCGPSSVLALPTSRAVGTSRCQDPQL